LLRQLTRCFRMRLGVWIRTIGGKSRKSYRLPPDPANDGKIKISKVVLKFISRIRTEDFISRNSIDKLCNTLAKADILRAHAPTLAGRIFTTSLKYNTPFVFSNEQYIAWCRAFIGLPPGSTIGNHTEQKDFDYPVQRCLALHMGESPYLDADGAHAAAHCPAASAGKFKKHGFLIRVLARAAKEAGLKCDVEPDTYGLLLQDFTRSECRRIFPKYVSQKYKDSFNAVLNALELVSSDACVMDEPSKYAYVQAKINSLPALSRDDAAGLRIDLSLENEDSGETKWVDVTAVHTGAASFRDKELKAVSTRQITAQLASSLAIPDPLKNDTPSPTLLDRTKSKDEKYSRLVWVAKKQVKEKRRKQVPTFWTFAVSDYGEVSPAAQDLMDWIIFQYRGKCEREASRADGCKVLDLVRDFRHRLRVGVQMAIAAGCGEMLCRAGHVWR
jgi:hypothetical protein